MAKRLRPSPALIIAIIALFVSIGGVGYAASKIGTNDIKNQAVTKQKIAKKAVTTGRLNDQAVTERTIRDQAVTTGKLADGAVSSSKVDGSILTANTVGVPIAGMNIDSNGTVRQFFNRVGGAPTVSHTANSGNYTITIPGLQGKVLNSASVSLASLQNSLGEIRVSSTGGDPLIFTADSSGTAADRAFEYVVFQRSP